MNPFLLPADDRLAHWKEFRRTLSAMDELAQLRAVAAYWAQAPLLTIAYDPADASHWPTPWEMIYRNNWCRSSVAIGMESTLRLAGFPTDHMCLKLIIDRDVTAMLLCLVIDDKWLLNYDWGIVKYYPKTVHSIRTWRYKDKAYVPLD